MNELDKLKWRKGEFRTVKRFHPLIIRRPRSGATKLLLLYYVIIECGKRGNHAHNKWTKSSSTFHHKNNMQFF